MSTFLCSVTSSSDPQSGQDHRSSGNFSTEEAPSGTTKLTFSVDPTSNTAWSTLTFDVKEDNSMWLDKTVYSGVKNGSVENYTSNRSYYIANPSGATGSTFVVNIYAS